MPGQRADVRRQSRGRPHRAHGAARDGITRRARVHEHGSLRVRCPGRAGRASSRRSSSTPRAAWRAATASRSTSTAEPGARLVVTTAAAEKVYRALDPGRDRRRAAHRRRRRRARLAAAGDDPVRPGEAAAQRSRSISRTMRGCCWPKRSCSAAPAWARRSDDCELFDRWRLRRGGRLVHAEAMRLDGAIAGKLARPAVANGGVAVATVLVVPGDERRPRRCARSKDNSAARSASRPGTAWRSRGCARADGAALRHDLVAVLSALRAAPLPRLWLN